MCFLIGVGLNWIKKPPIMSVFIKQNKEFKISILHFFITSISLHQLWLYYENV